jgi:transcriptional regulator with XRE-family HTH domain
MRDGGQDPGMDDQRAGAMLRAARLRRGWRQGDLAKAAGVSDATVSRIERGHLSEMSLAVMRRVAAPLDIRLELLPRSRAADLDRLVSARHAALGEAVIERFTGLEGWLIRPEVSFGIYGERGVVDLLAWHAERRALLVIELKTEIVDLGELLGTLDRKRRLGPEIVETLGWQPATVSAWLIVAEGMTNRRRIDAHAGTFRAALPDDGRTVRAWLARPVGELRALTFVPDRRPGNVRSGFATPRRVRTRPSSSPKRIRSAA